MVEPLIAHIDTKEDKIPGNWNADLGGMIIPDEAYRFTVQPVVTPMREGQDWTDLNMPYADDLKAAAARYKAEGRENKTVLTLQALSVAHHGLADHFGDFLSTINQDRMASHVWEGRSQQITLSLATCQYSELLAYARKDIPGLENPNGLLISLLVKTADNKFVFARRKLVSIGVGKIGVIGGTDDYDAGDDVPTPLHIAGEEVYEELGVAENESDSRLITLMEDKLKRPVLFYNTVLTLSSDQVLERWRNSKTAQAEHSELIFIKDEIESIIEFASTHSPDDFHEPADLIFQYILLQKIAEEKVEGFYNMPEATSTPF